MIKFEVTEPAQDVSLLSIQELRAAANIADGSKDAELQAVGLRSAMAIARACRVPFDGVNPPTLLNETVRDTIWLERPRDRLMLTRRPVTSVVSVDGGGEDVEAPDFVVQAARGMLRRLCNDTPAQWSPAKLVVEYKAGYETAPHDLKLAASKLVQTFWIQARREPGLKREEIFQVETREFWVAPHSDPALPQEVVDLLSPYYYRVVG